MAEIRKYPRTEQDCPAGYKNCDGYIIPNEWSVIRFNSLFKRLTRKNDENNQNVLTISAQQGLVSQMDYYNTLYASENKEGYSLLHRGDFSYNKSYSSEYAYGAIKRLDAYDKGIVSPLYICFTPQKGTNSDFYLQYFEAGCFNREIYKIAQEGARNHGLLNVSTEDFFNSMLVIPPLAEQERIAEILMQCDKVIELKQKRIEEEKKKKIWLYRRILTGKTRLKGYETPWVETTIGEQVEYLVGYPFESASFLNDGIKLLRGSNVKRGNLSWGTDITAYWSEDSSISDYLCQEGDIVIAMDGAQVGRSFSRIGNNDLPCYLVQRVARLRSNINGLIVQWIGGSRFARHIDQRKTSTAIPHMTIKDILSYEISIPTDEKEIEHISQLLNQQDQFIDLLEKEMNELCNRKASLAKLLLTGIVRTKV